MIRLNKKEEEIMRIFWKLQKAFPKEIMALLQNPAPPYNTVLSMIRKLEKDNFVGHHKIGKTHQYYPLISKVAYQKSLMGHLLTEYFGGSHEQLLSFFAKEENLSKEDLETILNNAKE